MKPDPTASGPGGEVAGLTRILDRHLPESAVRLSFHEVGESVGLEFTHLQAPRGSLLPEDMGPGLAWGDYDDDGDPDLYLVNFRGPLGADPEGSATPALFRNDGGYFTDVTEAVGLDDPIYGIGSVWADHDGDGDLDLYVTAFGQNRLYRNDNGRFTDVAEELGLDDPGFGAGASWADYDRDGDLDLYVTNYVEFELSDSMMDRDTKQYGTETPFTINPSSFPPQPNRLFRNDGPAGFVDVAEVAGVGNPQGRSLSVAWMDFDDDGWPDLYVANDVSDNGVFWNRGDGTFKDIGASSLAADYRGAMGLAVADSDLDGDQDLFVTHWLAQENAFFENMAADGMTDRAGEERLFFMDSADMLGLGQASLGLVGWATDFADLDNDGDMDLWLINGHTLQEQADARALIPQPMNIYQREPDGFYEVGAQSIVGGPRPIVGRGGAQADFDGDGRIDIAAAVHGGRPRLLRNVSQDPGHWVALDLRQSDGNSRALGARVEVHAGGHSQVRWHGIGGGYLSQPASLVHVGLGRSERVDRIEIRWPGGQTQVLEDLEADRTHRIRKDHP